MRHALVLLVLFLALSVSVTAQSSSPAFGAFGTPGFEEYEVPTVGGLLPFLSGGAPEPTIGIPWDSDHVFYHAGAVTMRGVFDDGDNVTWTDVTAPYQLPISLDPMLHVDPDTGRIWAGGLHGGCSVMMISDDDGESWIPAGNMCSGKDYDHQSIGSGPGVLPVTTTHPHVAYYCAQGGTISCAFSLDGGETWGPFQPVLGDCRGFHGHIRVSRATGFAAVPVGDCGGDLGFIATADGGLSWSVYTIPETEEWTNGFDPSLQFSRPNGWLYYGMASEWGVHVGLSKDEGETWEPIGAGMGVEPTHWLDIGQFHDPPVVAGTFVDVQAGDDERVAVAFLGLEGPRDTPLDVYGSNRIYRCDGHQDALLWHYYVAFSYDAGQNWTVTKLTEDPVQVGGIYDSVVDGPGDCRNLLDFNDMDIDSRGRVHIGWADGCVDACAENPSVESEGAREQVGKLFRQVTGRSLFAAEDTGEGPQAWEPAGPGDEGGQRSGTPAPGVVVGIGMIVGMLALARRRTP